MVTPIVVMARVRETYERSFLTLDRVGRRMGYPRETAAHAAWQFIYTTKNPHVSTLIRYARAMRVSPSKFLTATRTRA